jgi:hypothetical protein
MLRWRGFPLCETSLLCCSRLIRCARLNGFDFFFTVAGLREERGRTVRYALEVRTKSRSVHPLQASERVSIERLDAASLDYKKARRDLPLGGP